MKTFPICFVALFAVVSGRSVIDDYEYVNFGTSHNQSIFDGGIDEKIVGGEDTTIEEHPHQISFRKEKNHICGASVITRVRALTAAHCVEPDVKTKHYSILAGSTTRRGDANAQIRTLSKYVKHAGHDDPRYAFDIALLFWEQPLTFGANVQPIRIPAATATVPYGQSAVTTGWGRLYERGPSPNILKVVTLPLVNNEDCLKAFDNLRPEMLCAGGEAGRGGCNGDSGGPLVFNNTLIGLTSWGRPCANAGFPTVYARVSFFIDWINKHFN